MNQAKPPTLSSVLGAGLRSIRDQRGHRQDDVARLARSYGLRWTRTTVAKTERGERAMTLEELVLLSLALRLPPSAFVPGRGRDMVAITDDAALSTKNLRALLDGRRDDVVIPGQDTPVIREAPALFGQIADSLESAVAPVWPNPPDWAVEEATTAANNDAEVKASRRLGIHPFLVALAACRRWGRTLTAERDERVAATAPVGGSVRTLTALRGHMTRQLVAELESEIRPPAASASDHGKKTTTRRKQR